MSRWAVELSPEADKQLKKMDRQVRSRIEDFINESIATRDDPREIGRQLLGDLSHLWRYRVGPYRLLCTIKDDVLLILVVSIGDRKDIYR